MHSTDRANRHDAGSLAVEEQSALLATVFAHSSDGMAFIDPDFIIRVANESFARQMVVPLDQISGRLGEEVIPGWTDQVRHTCREVWASGQPLRAEAHPFELKDRSERGVTYGAPTVSPIYGAEGIFLGYLLLLREVTGGKLVEEERCRAQGLAGEAPRLA